MMDEGGLIVATVPPKQHAHVVRVGDHGCDRFGFLISGVPYCTERRGLSTLV